jgi:hypothetical protein
LLSAPCNIGKMVPMHFTGSCRAAKEAWRRTVFDFTAHRLNDGDTTVM